MKFLVHLGLVLWLLFSGSNQAQTPPVRFEHLSTRQGLSNNFISSITQDQQGFLWFGTADGLNKFDGYEFTAFQFDPGAGSNTLQHTIVTDVHEDRKGRIWVTTMGGGLHQVDKRTGKVTAYSQHAALSYYWNVHFNLFEDRAGLLWLGTPLGLLRFDPATGKFTQFPMERVNHIIGQDAQGDLLIEVKSRGQLFRFNAQTGQFNPLHLELPNLTHNPDVWRRAASGRQFALPYQADKPVSPYAFMLDKSGELWIGTEGNGLFDFMGAPGARAGRGNQLKPSEYFKRNFSITTSGVEDPLVLRFCIDKLGIDSVMWAIDYPFQPTGPAVAFIDSAPLTDEERAKVAHGNAERIFGI